jgi:general secretion pathway protein L
MTDLARQATGRRSILVADGSHILLTRAEVPSRQKSTILKAIPYALEDHFAEDVEELHFAIGERDAEGGIPVAVVREGLMTEWLDRCQEGGITPSAVVAEPLLVPYTEGETVLLMDGERVLVRTGAASGYVADRDMLAVLLTVEPPEEPAGDAAEEEIGEDVEPQTRRTVLRIYGQVDPSVLPSSDTVEIHREGLEVDPLVVLAHQFRPASVINLLQGPHSPRARVGRLLNPWRAAAAVMLLIVVTQFGVNLVERFRLQRESEALTQRIEQIYRRAFPNARKGGDPRLLMESHLKAMRAAGGAGDTGLLDLLTQAGPLLSRVKDVQITGLNYREGGLTLSLTAPSLQTVDQLRQSLASNRPLEVEIQSASSRDGKVNSRLLIREATL